MDKKWLYRIGVTLLPGIGSISAKNLISYCGSEEAVFHSKKTALLKIPGIGERLAQSISTQQILGEAEKILKDVQDQKISVTHYLENDYPKKLKFLPDSPLMLYYKGNFNFNHNRIISIVGTRNATDYGKSVLEEWMEKLKAHNLYIISGLAYGIDIHAHKAALKQDIPTIGVLAHGLDMIYPGQHKKIADQMIEKGGGLVTEFPSGTRLIREFFPRRNRIVAGICDALIVVETKEKGGSMITAELANSYSRDVYALPGSLDMPYSQGCNYLIKTHKAQLIDNIDDLLKDKDWKESGQAFEPVQTSLELNFHDADTKVVYEILSAHKMLEIDKLVKISNIESSKVASALLNLEFEGMVKALPGKKYRLMRS